MDNTIIPKADLVVPRSVCKWEIASRVNDDPNQCNECAAAEQASSYKINKIFSNLTISGLRLISR